MEPFYLGDLAKIALAALVGASVGFEREKHGQAAGVRTYVLVCTGACLMMLLSLRMEGLFHSLAGDNSIVRVDPGRIASYAIASMGFLGAGAIIKGKGSVKGLTTAAGLWLVTGIGLSIGANFIIPALFTTLISLLFLFGLRRFKVALRRTEFIILTISCRGLNSPLDKIRSILSGYAHMTLHFINYQTDITGKSLTYRIRLSHREPVDFEEVFEKLRTIKCIDNIIWEESDIP